MKPLRRNSIKPNRIPAKSSDLKTSLAQNLTEKLTKSQLSRIKSRLGTSAFLPETSATKSPYISLKLLHSTKSSTAKSIIPFEGDRSECYAGNWSRRIMNASEKCFGDDKPFWKVSFVVGGLFKGWLAFDKIWGALWRCCNSPLVVNEKYVACAKR